MIWKRKGEQGCITINILSLNVKGLHFIDEIIEFCSYLIYNNYEVIALTETHFDFFREELFREVFAPFYYIFTNNRRGRKKGDKGSGGLAVLINKRGGNSTCMSPP